jgi:putative ABC transport system permease protein
VEERKRNLGQALANLDAFLSLVGFVALILGGIGVASALHAYIREKIATVAVLRCLGASARQSFAVYLVQGLALGLAGACAGGALGVAVQKGLPALFRGVLPISMDFFVSWPALLRGTGAGVVICLLFSAPPAAFREADPPARGPALGGPRRGRHGAGPVEAGHRGRDRRGDRRVRRVADGQARRWARLRGMLGLGFLVLAGLGVAVAWAARRFVPRGLPYVVRQGFANLHRPNNRTVLLLVSLGLGTFLVLTLFLVRTTLLREIRGGTRWAGPT